VLLEDRCLLHKGRKDSQVKIRGYRIEVGEIESALLEIDNVKEAAVLLDEDRSGDKYLRAYVASSSRPAPTVATLRRELARALPDWMVPSVFVMLDALPLLANGKLDRRGLLRAAGSESIADAPGVAPRTPVERTLATIWRDVLNVDAVGAHDNFLDLGGHSLAAARIVSEVGKRFAVELTVQSPFEFATVAEMAALIVERRKQQVTGGCRSRAAFT